MGVRFSARISAVKEIPPNKKLSVESTFFLIGKIDKITETLRTSQNEEHEILAKLLLKKR